MFTWERGATSRSKVRERLDRYVATIPWCSRFPNFEVTHLARYKSDHCPIMLTAKNRSGKQRRRKKGFKFETCWLLDEECEPLVRRAWGKGEGVEMQQRLEGVARDLVSWSTEKFKDLGKQIEMAEKALKAAQSRPISEASCSECVALEKELESLNEKSEAYWHLRSRVAEIKDRDKNTKYFHHKASQRRRRNTIKGLFDDQGQWRVEEEALESVFEHYFQNLFTSTNPTDEDMERVIDSVGSVITENMNRSLTRPFTKDEIHEALRQMHPSKAPGPDGMHAIFYQRFWHIVGDAVVRFIEEILHQGHVPEHTNRTNIALVPKIKNPMNASDFRPISLCNVLYKLVSKCVVLRLKNILPQVVTENQSAFVPGRLITDNALIALELFHSMKKRSRGRKGSMALKLDMSKAYDRVEWGFLQKLLLTMGFDGRWVNLVMNCVTSVRYSVILNGGICGDIIPQRGLRQGDPLSPYLFILIADAFSKMLLKRVHARDIHGVKASRNGPEIPHLLFADDSLLFTRANRKECAVIVDILNQYELASGQKINYDKSEVSFSGGVRTGTKEEVMGILKMRQVDFHGKYLGVPTILGRSKKVIFESLLERIRKKIRGWKEQFLSRAGKEVLLKSVIQAIPTYIMSMYKIPVEVIGKMKAAMANFWWGGKDERRKFHWKNWDAMCSPKVLGGMGFRDLEVFNVALLGRQAWRLIRGTETLLGRVMKAKYFPNRPFLDSSLGLMGSYSWRSIWSSKALIKEGIIWRVGNGKDINIWNDPWVVNEESRFISSPPIDGLSKVNSLINVEQGDWNEELIAEVFEERDVKCILAIPLSERLPRDELIWAFSKDGDYSVKTAYMIGKGCDLDLFHQAWVDIWVVNASPKVRHFLWRMCTESIPVRGLLKARHITESASCPWCNTHEESTQHALFECTRAREIWEACDCNMLLEDRADMSLCDRFMQWKKYGEKACALGGYIVWNIWWERNRKVFEDITTLTTVIGQRIRSQVDDKVKC
ncbi:hypothetical protein RDABS01_021279 [Bienertia sinuspersici]